MSGARGGGGPPAASRFAPGKSGNAGGRPKSLPRFRKRCRDLSFALLAEIGRRIGDKEIRDCVPTPALVEALKDIAPHGGFLPADRQAAVDTNSARLLLLALAIKDLPDDKRAALMGLLGDSKS